MSDVPPGDHLLHVIVIKGFCSPEAAAEATGLPDEVIAAGLAQLADQGLAQHREGRISGWSPTPAGRTQHGVLLDGPLAATDPTRAHELYERFADLNATFKQVCTDWQVRTAPDGATTPNDHADPSYDRAVIARLEEVHTTVSELCTELAPVLARVDRYQARLADAVGAVSAGEADRFTRPLNRSYHDVWMELHQDLLLTLKRARTSSDT